MSPEPGKWLKSFMEALNKSFDRLRTNGKLLIPFVVSLSNHEWNQLKLKPAINCLWPMPGLLRLPYCKGHCWCIKTRSLWHWIAGRFYFLLNKRNRYGTDRSFFSRGLKAAPTNIALT
jgi:hypothetical protein